MNRDDIKHRFANRLEGKNGSIKAGNVSYEGRCYYSYYTVFGQWLDVEKKVVAIFDGSTSKSSNKHKLYSGVFPGDVHVFPLDLGGSSWNHCNLIGKYANKDSDFRFDHRMVMINHYVGRIYDQLATINGGKCKGLENVSFKAWEYVEELCSLYKDTTINKYIKTLKHVKPLTKNGERVSTSLNHKKVNAEIDAKKTLVKLLKDGERNVKTITDALFGEGTYASYMQRTECFRKTDKKRAQMEALCERLGIKSPYKNYGIGISTSLTAKQIRNLSAAKRLELHWKALDYEEYWKNHDAIKDKRIRSEINAYKWIVGYEPKKDFWGRGYEDGVRKCRNMFTGEEYDLAGGFIYGFWWCKTSISFYYDSFRKATNKKEWIENFYAEVAEVRNNRFAISILRDLHHGVFEGDKLIGYYQTIYKAGLDEEELNICMEFIRKCKAHYADEEARKRAEEIARIKREEEKRKEREYMEQVKQEQINECLSRGLEGCRDLWRNHFMEIDTAEDKSNNDANFFFGGNVLLRLSLSGNAIETSKHISIPVEKCKKMWKIVQKWHNDPSSFKSCEINTLSSGKYTISSYRNDILTSGCHKIPYVEMERVMAMVN